MDKTKTPKVEPFKIDLSLLDPNISDERVSELLYEGNSEKLYILAENPKFSNINTNVFKSISKEKVPISFNHPWVRISIYIAILFVLGLVKIFPFWLTSAWFVFCALYYIFKFKAYNLSMELRERERINNLNELVIGSPYELPENKRIREKRERLEALKEMQREEEIDKKQPPPKK